jgi:NitT/TauT family transport system ATP-binding protein
MKMSQIQIKDLFIDFSMPRSEERLVVVSNLNIGIERGEFVTIVGSSGCGKSTLLLAIAGLVKPSEGTISMDGQLVTGPSRERAPVFQDASLLPWRTVLGNVCFGLELQRWKRDDISERAKRYIRMVGLSDYTNYYPHQLSGGMRQRVNIARALAVDPEVLLMDEPFGALDAQTREIMGNELLKIWGRDRKTCLFVTHDIDEAILLADRVIVMGRNPGHIKEVISIDLARPRDEAVLSSPEFADLRLRLRRHLSEDMASMRLVSEEV